MSVVGLVMIFDRRRHISTTLIVFLFYHDRIGRQ